MSGPMLPPAVAQARSNPIGFRRALGSGLRPLVAACRQAPLCDNFQQPTTYNTLNTRILFTAPSTTDLTDIVVGIPGSYWPSTPNETDWTTSYTVLAAIEYPLSDATTPAPLYKDGGRTLTVTPGRTLARFDPWAGVIPAGAQFAVRLYASWSVGAFPLSTYEGGYLVGGYTNLGTDLTDYSLTANSSVPSGNKANTVSQTGFGAVAVYARQRTQTAVLGLLGDSITAGKTGAEAPDPKTGALFLEKGLRGEIPVMNIARGTDGMALYMARNEMRNLFFRAPDGGVAITDMVFSFGRNDLTSSLASLQSMYQTCIGAFLARGIRVRGVTITPRTTSTDGWTSTANQTVDSTETRRQEFNSWLLANWSGLGLTGLLDWAHVIDPTDSGKWGFDTGLSGSTQNGAAPFATMSGRAIGSVARAAYNGNSASGSGYTNGASIPCIIYPMAGDSGAGGGAVTGVVNGTGNVTTYTVTAGGDYQYPPYITPPGRWTNDGLHPNVRGCIEILYQTGFGPQMFRL